MSVATELQRIIDAKADIKTAIEGKGVTVPSATKLDGYAALVSAIQTGGVTGLEYEAGTVTKSTGSNITISTQLSMTKFFVMLDIQTPTYGVNGCIGYAGTNAMEAVVSGSGMAESTLVGVGRETRTTWSGYATNTAYVGPSISGNTVTISARSATYPFQDGEYDYLLIKIE